MIYYVYYFGMDETVDRAVGQCDMCRVQFGFYVFIFQNAHKMGKFFLRFLMSFRKDRFL